MEALKICARVISALVSREAITRGGRLKFGYVWPFLEPAIYITILLTFRQVLGMGSGDFGDDGILFILAGILAVRTMLGIARKTMGAVGANTALLAYPVVKTFDVIVARILLEALTWSVTMAIFVVGLYAFAGIWLPTSPDTFIAAFVSALFFGAAFGFFNATFVGLFPYWQKVMSFISLPIYMTSGVFFSPSALPPQILSILWYNPLMHLIEWLREGIFLDYIGIVEPAYPLYFGIVLLFLGLLFNRLFQHKMLER